MGAENTRRVVARTLAVDLDECDLQGAAAERQSRLQDFLDQLDGEGIEVFAITEAMGAARFTTAEPGGFRDLHHAEPGTVYTVLGRRRASLALGEKD